MMKKYRIVICAVLALIMLASVLGFAGCNPKKERVANAALYPDDYKYRDYATEVDIDPEVYPDAAEQGLFWCKWDEDASDFITVPADSADGAALVDTSKPTIVMVHGVLLEDGHRRTEQYRIGSSYADPSVYDIDYGYINMVQVWLARGWNVATFSYCRFADEKSGINAIASPGYIESKVWAVDGDVGIRYRKADGSFSDQNLFDFSVSEFFMAEYIRAINLLPDTMGDQEIRIAGHSMGGQVVTAFTFLATEMVAVGQLKANAKPDRLTLLDPYFSSGVNFMRNDNITISWSGKKMTTSPLFPEMPTYRSAVADIMVECLKEITASGIPIEYYTEPASALVLGSNKYQSTIKQYVVYQTLKLSYVGNNEAHNGVREWYLMSLFGDEPPLQTEGNAISAQTSTQRIADLVGKEFVQVAGNTTQHVRDDVFAVVER